jgi:membrane protease YdiL (CAAX protease family)
MSKLILNSTSATAQTLDRRQNDLRAVWVFSLLTLVLTITVLLLLPGYAGAALVVFIPLILAVILISVTDGKSKIRPRLFSRQAWSINLSWLLISLSLALALRLGVSLLGLALIPDYEFQPGPLSPLLLIVFLFAAAEEIGWRGFALPNLLAHGYHPLAATIILGIPWALLHLPLVLPGMLSAGTPMVAQFLIMIALSILISWVYLGGRRSLSAAVLLHGGQNLTVILNNGLDPIASGWLMAAVYGAAALLVILLTRGRLGQPDEEVPIKNP